MINRPSEGEHNPYYSKYIALVTEPDLLTVLDGQIAEVRQLASSLTPQQETFAYAAGKWTVRQVLGHLIDVERVFGYRAFRIGRGDETPLPGFDENTYVASSTYADVPAVEIAREFGLVREANLAMLRRLDVSRWTLTGTANNSPISVRALGFIMAGHVRHHQRGLAANYGAGV